MTMHKLSGPLDLSFPTSKMRGLEYMTYKASYSSTILRVKACSRRSPENQHGGVERVGSRGGRGRMEA